MSPAACQAPDYTGCNVGLFSIFKKQDATREAPKSSAEAAEDAARLAANSEAERHNTQLQRDIARATAMKIDAIESAMAFDIFNEPEPAWGSRPPRPRPKSQPGGDDGATLPLLEHSTTQLLGEEELPELAIAAQTAPVVEEIAILYANGQAAVAQEMLVGSLPGSGAQDRTVWWMLFDLYQVTGQQDAFDSLSIDYASTFETSPPAWTAPVAIEPQAQAWSGVTPSVAFSGVLDENIAPQLERLMLSAATSPVLRLDFSRVNGVEPGGCALLLAALRQLQARQCELIVVAAAELAEQIRAIIAVGRRDDTEAPWLLLLELLQLLNREKDFEETSMDYCVTFEVSPPSFSAPHKVATAAKQHVSASPDRFMLPPVIETGLDALLASISAYADQYQTLVFDCSRLARVDFGAANQLQGKLQALAQDGKKIEFRDVNHLVAALLRLLGYADLARIYPHRY
jgi:ABC-type transporter Mla MlaB component